MPDSVYEYVKSKHGGMLNRLGEYMREKEGLSWRDWREYWKSGPRKLLGTFKNQFEYPPPTFLILQ